MARKGKRGPAFTGLPAKSITKGRVVGVIPSRMNSIGARPTSIGGRIGAVSIRGKHVNKRAGMATRKLKK